VTAEEQNVVILEELWDKVMRRNNMEVQRYIM
jgi:hypothetical protein